MKKTFAQLYLASTSPRRKELLQQIGVKFKILALSVDESVCSGESAETYVERVALKKARAVKKILSMDNCIVLAADTAVVIEGKILGKPLDKDHALAMLQSLSGKTHKVITSLALIGDNETCSRTCITEVSFKTLKETECELYWHTGEPRDKAGAYGIQGKGAVFVESITGSYSNVVGLPLKETAELLSYFNVPFWLDDAEAGVSHQQFSEETGLK